MAPKLPRQAYRTLPRGTLDTPPGMTGSPYYNSRLNTKSTAALIKAFHAWASGVPLGAVLIALRKDDHKKNSKAWTPRRFFRNLWIRHYPVAPDLDTAWLTLHRSAWRAQHKLAREIGVPPWAVTWALFNGAVPRVDSVRAVLAARLGEAAIARSLVFWRVYDPPLRDEARTLDAQADGSFWRELSARDWVEGDMEDTPPEDSEEKAPLDWDEDGTVNGE